MKLILLRHGQSGANVGLPGEMDGKNLTLKGVKQAEATAKKLKNKKIKTIYCSPADRCMQTMDEILEVKKEHVSINLSRLIGPKLKKETLEKVEKRINLFLEDLSCELEEKESVLIISHLSVLKMFTYLLKDKTWTFKNGEIREIGVTNYSK